MFLGIVMDVVALWAIASLLAGRNMAEDWFRYLIFVFALIMLSALLMAGEVTLLPALILYFLAIGVGMRYLVGATWRGAAIGGALFVAYQVVVGLIF